ncbi:hypothetical protein PR048_028393 [Dryococelus australis]|uniref:Uncharacterized protein n=1 Tax=Dryococelus australis TaxID=614101 RepID=A0ABQ9GAV6_9NEOP|nr:hypothetical protein PR048_028393 [Dryococelus australis]
MLQLNQQIPATGHQQELNGFIESSPIYVTSLPETKQAGRPKGAALSNGHVTSSVEEPDSTAEIELTQELTEGRSASPFVNGRTEVLIGQEKDTSRVCTTAIVENHRGLAVADDAQIR